ncbi:MAG: putative Zn-dependent hydrolase, partial [Bacteroidetes bacterium]|nr:putative Zn-dependent hydrolase [Bacteroidota bacterium]
FFIRIGGVRLLTDPVFGDILAVKRVSPFPVNPILLTKLDYILLSHDHRDHCDKPTLQRLARNNPKATYLTGLGMEPLLKEFTGSELIQEAGWYQQYLTEDVKITYVPARHWGKRGAFDTNRRLWGGFVIESAQRRIYFGGDSGYDTHYQQLKEVFGGFDYALLGIGAFEPEWFMHPVHQSPALAIKAMEELNAGHAIPMHFGTFDLSDEPLDMPLKVFKQVATAHGLEKRIKPLRIGEALHLA